MIESTVIYTAPAAERVLARIERAPRAAAAERRASERALVTEHRAELDAAKQALRDKAEDELQQLKAQLRTEQHDNAAKAAAKNKAIGTKAKEKVAKAGAARARVRAQIPRGVRGPVGPDGCP